MSLREDLSSALQISINAGVLTIRLMILACESGVSQIYDFTVLVHEMGFIGSNPESLVMEATFLPQVLAGKGNNSGVCRLSSHILWVYVKG